jgi:sugar phosphate isomerase/epimerase
MPNAPTGFNPARRHLLGTALGAASLAVPALSVITPARAQGSPGFFAARDLPVGVQLYTVGAAAQADLDGTFRRIAEIGYRIVELAGMHGHTPAVLRAAADRAGLELTGIHMRAQGVPGEPGLEDEPGKLAGILGTLGITEVTMPIMIMPPGARPEAGENFGAFLMRAGSRMTADDWKRNADFLNARGKLLLKEGIRLGYHNHNFEFRPLGNTTGWEILVGNTDPATVDFELDAGWVAAAGHDPVKVLGAMQGRARQIHVKDILATTQPNFGLKQDPTEVGSGMLQWNAILPAAWDAGVRRYYVEQEPPFAHDRFESLAISHRHLTTKV